MMYRLLKEGRYKFGDETLDVTPSVLDKMAQDTPMPMPILLRHNAELVVGQVTKLLVMMLAADVGEESGLVAPRPRHELWADVEELKLVLAFSLDPPLVHEVSLTGHQWPEPEPLPESLV